MSRPIVIALCALLALACEEAPPEAPEAPPDEPPVAAPQGEPAMRLHVPPRLIHRGRREAAGLARMPGAIRRQTLEARRDEDQPTYDAIRLDAASHERAGVSFEGRIGFVRPAGDALWILPLFTRRDGERWVDPLYVLSVVPPELPAEGGAVARVDGWIVGDRAIGQNTLPLVLAYSVERADE